MMLRNMAMMTGLNVAKAAASVFISLLIAGHVPPDQFGLVALAVTLMTLIMLITDMGLSSAIVREPDLDQHKAGSAIGLMGVAGLLGGLLIAVAAAPVEKAMGLAGLTPVLLGFGLVTACSVWATGPRALLERQLSYQRISTVEAVGLILALVVFFVSLRAGVGVMAIVAFHAVLQAVRAVAFTVLARPCYVVGFDLRAVSPLARVGGSVLGANLLSYSARNLDRMLIGPVIGATALGLYGLAYQFMTIPLMLISWPASGVLLSTLSRLGRDSPAQSKVICAVFTATAAISIPMMTFLTFGAHFPVGHFYAGRWGGLSEIIAILAPVGAVQSIAAYNSAVLLHAGRIRLNFMLGVVNGVGLSAVFLCSVWFGLKALVISYAVAAFLISVVVTYYTCVCGRISAAQMLRCIVPGAAAAGFGVIAVAATTGFASASLTHWLNMMAVYVLAVVAAYVVQRASLLSSVSVLVHTRISAGSAV
jgi:O-antigen/teichoic acid export membrane protein